MKLRFRIEFAVAQAFLNQEKFTQFRNELRELLHKHFPGWDIAKHCPIKVEWIPEDD